LNIIHRDIHNQREPPGEGKKTLATRVIREFFKEGEITFETFFIFSSFIIKPQEKAPWQVIHRFFTGVDNFSISSFLLKVYHAAEKEGIKYGQ